MREAEKQAKAAAWNVIQSFFHDAVQANLRTGSFNSPETNKLMLVIKEQNERVSGFTIKDDWLDD